MHDALRRHRALEKTQAKYAGKPFAWGRNDCVRMARAHLVAMGHRKIPKIPPYSSGIGAKRALKAAGAESIEGLLDGLLPRIAPAMMRIGDIAVMQGDELFDAITICAGRKFIGWHGASDRDELVEIRSGRGDILGEIKAAYRA